MNQSEIVAAAANAAIRALREPGPFREQMTLAEMEAMYLAQCEATDEWAKRARAAEQAKAPAALRKRIDDLERDLAKVNQRLAVANGPHADVLRAAAQAARESLDDCTHPDCVEARALNGYSSCAGGYLARQVVKAILGSSDGDRESHG